MIETLDDTSRSDIVETFVIAFGEHPMLPRDPSGRKTRMLANALMDTYAGAPDSRVFGIRRDGRLDCAAFVFDTGYQPRAWSMLRLLVRMLWVIGWKITWKFAQVLAERPGSMERRLELMVLGTRPECQGQGLGRVMLRHVLDFARSRGYKAVVLEVAKETPAFGFYLREGFLVEKEIEMPGMPLCLLRCPLAGEEAAGS